jgi:hypothetical protein
MSYDYEDSFGNSRNSDGTFNGQSYLGDQFTQREAGVGIYDTPQTAAWKVEDKQRRDRERLEGLYSSAYVPSCHALGPSGSMSRSNGLGRTFVRGLLLTATIFVMLFGALWAYESRDRIPGQVEGWAVENSFRGQNFSPLSAYESFIPPKSRNLLPPTKKLIRDMVTTRMRPMSDVRRRKLGAVAWQCASDPTGECLEQARRAELAGGLITIQTGMEFLAYARSKGSAAATADLGLAHILFDAPSRARSLAQAEWEKGMRVVPNADRAKSLLDLSREAWPLRVSDLVSRLFAAANGLNKRV